MVVTGRLVWCGTLFVPLQKTTRAPARREVAGCADIESISKAMFVVVVSVAVVAL